MNIYVICPVRNCPPDVGMKLDEHVRGLEECACGDFSVYYPPRDTPQADDGIGLAIVQHQLAAMKACDEVHIWYDPASKGSHVDLGMALALGKQLRWIQPPARTAHKSYANVILALGCPT